MDSNNLSNLISEFKNELIEIYKEFQSLKKEILLLQNYEGIFKHLMCKNTEYKEEKGKEKECDNSLYLSKDIPK